MKYMHSEWKARLAHWLDTLKKDLYQPLGPIVVEAFFTMDHLTPQQAAAGDFAPMKPGAPWGRTWEYCWMRSAITLPESAAGKRIVMDLQTGGESTLFVNGRSFGTRRAEWVTVPHHYICDNCLTECAEAGASYDLLIEAYAGHFFPESALGGCATGPVLPGSYADPKEGGLRTALGSLIAAVNAAGFPAGLDYPLYIALKLILNIGGALILSKIQWVRRLFGLPADEARRNS